MPLLEKLIKEKLLKEIIEIVSPLEALVTEQSPEDRRYYSPPLLPYLVNKAIKDKEYNQNIQKIKLNYYQRNLLLLEKILEKQDILDNTRLALKVVRENLGLENISSYINSYHLYDTYRKQNLFRYKTKEFLLQEPPEFHQLEKFLNSIKIE